MQITNYDVLVEADDEDGNFRLANENHVGNKRFEVFLNLHKEGYQQARQKNDEATCEQIVSKILDIVCHKCIPNGRFLEKVQEGDGWLELGEGQLARSKIHQALNAGNNTPYRSSKVFTHTQGEKSSSRNDDGKRRRRGSYARLRRSISESMLFHSTQSSSQEKPDILMSSGNDDDEDVDVKLEQMDVLIASNRKGLSNSTQNPGNNRFKIMINMHRDRYNSGSEDERVSIVEDLKKTVQDHWKGRFLINSLLGYEKLSDSETSKAITMIFQYQQEPKPIPSAAPVLVDTPSHVPSLATATFGSEAFQSPAQMYPMAQQQVVPPQQMSPFSAVPMVTDPSPFSAPVFARTATAPPTTFNNPAPPANFPNSREIQNLRSAAVQGLKARKQKRAIMNRIGKTGGKKDGMGSSSGGGTVSKGIFLVSLSLGVLASTST